MSDLMVWYDYYMKMYTEATNEIESGSYYAAAQSILRKIRRECAE